MQETQPQNSETVRAIWNKTLTLKIVLGEDIDQEETPCEWCADHGDDDDDNDEPLKCDALAWPKYNGPLVVSGDGRAHFCEDCVREIDAEFVDYYEWNFADARGAIGEEDFSLDEWMEALANNMRNLCEYPVFIERGPCLADR